MKNSLTIFIVSTFLLWILPLGFFIQPSQEKTACDGQRAMCMCRLGAPKADKPVMAGININAASAHKDNSSSASNYFVSPKAIILAHLSVNPLGANQFLPFTSLFILPLEHVPKI